MTKTLIEIGHAGGLAYMGMSPEGKERIKEEYTGQIYFYSLPYSRHAQLRA
jgi:hypothetical protein